MRRPPSDTLDGSLMDLLLARGRQAFAGDMAYRVGRFRLGKPTPEEGRFIEVYRRQSDGSWKCVGDIFNFNSDPATA